MICCGDVNFSSVGHDETSFITLYLKKEGKGHTSMEGYAQYLHCKCTLETDNSEH